jgi:DNA-directed RNA polymerase subunit alpha
MNISLPQKATFKKIDENSSQAIIGPCHPGYGITLGNALKRVLLSSLEGGAVYRVKIKGVQHEFSTIPDVLEDVIEIILNLKQIDFKMHTDEEVKITLEVKGKKEVKAKDIKLSSDVEVINPDAHIATLNSAKAEIKIDLFVKKGRGYWPVEDREEEAEIGVIAVDSFFGPVEKVGLKIENTRVEQMTNYENIILDIQTNGVITPEEALKTANDILLDQFNAVDRNLGGAEVKEEKPKKAAKKETKEKKEDKKEDKKDKEEKKATKKEKK